MSLSFITANNTYINNNGAIVIVAGLVSGAFLYSAVTVYLRTIGPDRQRIQPESNVSILAPPSDQIGKADGAPAKEKDTESGVPVSDTPSSSVQAPVIVPAPQVAAPSVREIKPASSNLLWGAYVGNNHNNIDDFENLVGREIDLYADFEGWHEEFPSQLKKTVGEAGKTLIIFWEPSFGYDDIIDHSRDDYIQEFAAGAKSYSYPVILVPFPEMNLDEEAWGYGQNGNTAEKFLAAWRLVHDLFSEADNVKFGLAYNHVSVPDVRGNRFSDYYPGDAYVDYVGVDGFNFDDPGLTFSQIFDDAIRKVSAYNKPVIIFSMGSAAGPNKAEWISEGLGEKAKTYGRLVAWIWFNQGGSPNWLVNSDDRSLRAFREVIPKK